MFHDDRHWLLWLAATPVPVPFRGHWCRVRVRIPSAGHPPPTGLVLTFNQAGPVRRQDWLALRCPTGKAGRDIAGEILVHVPAEAEAVRIGVLGSTAQTLRADVSFVPMSRLVAACRVALRHCGALLRHVRHQGVAGFRATLARLSEEPDPLEEYHRWIALFERPPEAIAPGAPSLAALVFQAPGGGASALRASVAALERQSPPVPHAIVTGGNWRGALAALTGDYVAILQAGEIPHDRMSHLSAAALAGLGNPVMACADEDTLDVGGRRRDPHFKPRPNHLLMLSGTLTRGLWLIRLDVLAAAPNDLQADWAETLRLDLWLRLHELGRAETPRIPHILTHRRADTLAAPGDALARVVTDHLRRAGLPWRAEADFPVRIRPATDAAAPPVSILIASTLAAPHAASCLRAVLAGTAYPDVELLIAVSQPAGLNDTQSALARELQADPRVRVIVMRDAAFNYATVNNRLAAQARGELLCLLNDDVAPIGPDWLRRLAAWFADRKIAAVGPRLLYPDDTVQHGGIVMGLGGVCNHAHRYLPSNQVGYAGRAALAQEMSAVTGACLLVRRIAFHAVGGLDEAYPAAFNDVDFCLRLRESGFGVVYDGATTLHHLENTTYGAAAASGSAVPDSPDGLRMRRRWAELCRSDPFHNPNLDLTPGREWQLAWPPRGRDPA